MSKIPKFRRKKSSQIKTLHLAEKEKKKKRELIIKKRRGKR
jgi:hypothetical protein